MSRSAEAGGSLERQIARLDRRLDQLARLSNAYSWARLVAFVVAVALTVTGLVIGGAWGVIAGFVMGALAFGLTATAHARLKRGIARMDIWRGIKSEHVARLSLAWDQLPPALFSAPRAGRALELDLDLTGPVGLHRLLDTCVSRDGSLRLRDWLTSGEPDPPVIVARQALVGELIRLSIFRDKLRLSAMLVTNSHARRWRGERLEAWIKQPAPSGMDWRLLIVVTLLGLANIVLLALNTMTGFPAVWRFTALLYVGLYLYHTLKINDPFSEALALRDPLEELEAVFVYLEMYRYGENSRLGELCAPFWEGDHRPSAQLRRVTRVLSAASVRRNPLLWMIVSAVFPWDMWVSRWLEQSRASLVDLLPQWLDTWFELEALCALATFAYLNPTTVFPAVREGRPWFEARALGHPLIAAGARVCNDFLLDQSGEMVMITGSNMSGKSTFLRTLGVNICMAYAGSTVMATQLRLAPVRLRTCIRVTDSLTDGISYFYAEVTCLKGLLDALADDHPYSVFYLIDEIFRGTNNRERLIGSRAYIRALVGQRGAGALSTHDLELVTLADEIPSITNRHFAETIADGRMSFDYKLRLGPCPTTNALTIMRLQGLPVE